MKVLILLFALTGCVVSEPESISALPSSLCVLDEDGNWVGDECGYNGGDGGGGDGAGNLCYVSWSCDPTFGTSSDVVCMQACGNFSARCYNTYRCNNSCGDVAHIGYCGVF